MVKQNEIANYREFVNSLKKELKNHKTTPRKEWMPNAIKCVNGLAAEELRKLVDIETRRKYGTFFTDSTLAKQVLKFLKPDFSDNSIVYDPACGAGNLLISVADYMLQQKKIQSTNGKLLGTDIHDEFVQATKLRLLINEVLHCDSFPPRRLGSHASIRTADALAPNTFYERATHIVINPPFNLTSPEDKLSWSKGKVSAAALFIEKAVNYVNPGTPIYAILPDVLRSGSRYEKWRDLIRQKCIVGEVKLLGQFDNYTDIDVFAIKLTKKKKLLFVNRQDTTHKQTSNQKTIEDLFDVCVGPVVDNRDPYEGKSRDYIVSKGLQGWTENRKTMLKRKHKGKAFESPFVVIKRTSRMGDSSRAIATIINMPRPVYVDNHLIVLKPKSGTLEDCYMALSILKRPETDNWLNNEIRCRHLTVKLVSKIPIWS